MRHATDQALDQLEDLLTEIRKYGHLKENKRGIFYFKSMAFLHFHEDPAGLFADLRVDGDFQRFCVNSITEQKILVSKVKDAITRFKESHR